MDGSEKYLRLCENVLETLYEKHWLGKGAKEESQAIGLTNWVNYGAIHEISNMEERTSLEEKINFPVPS